MSDIHISLAAEKIVELGPLSVTNSMVASLIASAVILIVFSLSSRRIKMYPGSGFANLVEAVMETLMGAMEQVIPDRAQVQRFFPFLMTLFIFILMNNWLGLLPGFGSITITTEHGVVPLLRGATADLNTTLALAIISVVLSHWYAIRELGLFTHLKKYISLNPIMLFIGFLEVVSEFSKMISFSFRLFGNIFAGEVLLVVISYLMPLVAPLPFFALELFVGLVQAIVFTMLSLVFLQLATSSHEGEGSHAKTAPSVEAVSP